MYTRYKILCLLLLSSLFAQAGKKVVYLRGMTLNPSREQMGATASVDVYHDKKEPEGFLSWTVNDQHTLATPIDENRYLVHINNLHRWSPDHTATYDIGVTWGKDTLTRSFGLHEVESHRGHFFINDTTYLLKGLTEAALPISQETTEQQWQDFFRSIKAEGFNFVTLRSYMLTAEMLDAADNIGLLIHTTEAEAPVKEEVDTGKKKKKKKKKNEAPVVIQTLGEQWGHHPSLCLLTSDKDTKGGIAGHMLPTHLFNPEEAKRDTYLADYAQLVDTTGICLADLSQLQQADSLDVIVERVLCTEGVGGIVFASRQQAKALKPLMILGKTDRDYWDSSMSMHMNLYVANNTREVTAGQRLNWFFTDQNGQTFSTGSAGGLRFDPLASEQEADIFSPMANVFPGTHVTLTVKLEGTDLWRSWRTKIGYPARIRFMNEEVQKRMQQWCKRLPGEDKDSYKKRVNAVTKAKQKKLYAYSTATEMAGDLLKKMSIKLSPYDQRSSTVTISMGKGVPDFKLRVPRDEAESFCNASDLELRNTIFALSNKDEYEIAYTEVVNRRTGASFIYDNRDGDTLERLFIDDKYVSAETREIVEREDSLLRSIKQNVVEEAKRRQLITDNTQIDVRAHILTDYDEEGRTLNNYQIVFNYNVDARYSLTEDFGPGRFHIEDSHAALSMLNTITTAFDKEFARYIKPGQQLDVVITGSADSSPIRGSIKYDGLYGFFQNHPYYLGEEEGLITIDQEGGITQNEQLAFLRAQGVNDFLVKNLTAVKDMDVSYRYNIELPQGRGGQFRRIKVAFTFVNVFKD